MAARTEDLLQRWTGEAVPVSFNAGFVALSYVVSLLGAGSTLELINRRTSLKGLYNHLLLVGAAISMGGIAIWSMHYIGNRSIILLNGEAELQLAYSTGITAASFFVPIVVLLLAFVAVSSNDQVQWWRICLAGSLSGSAICGMHYLGGASISNYECQYETANIIGATIIAVSASSIALALFFVFRAAWTNSLLKRVGCALVLAGAVSGMHWCASLGTRYKLLHAANWNGDGASQNTTVIVVICLCLAASTIMIATAVLTAQRMKRYATKAQQIVLAAAVFDNQGRILVTPEGLLPSEKITDTFPQKSLDDNFSTAHPIFHWMFRASRNWPSVSALLGWMTTHLDNLPPNQRGGRSAIHLMEENGQLFENYDIVFRELFCLAAASLAAKMMEDIVNAGALWGEIFHTGTETQTTRPSTRLSTNIDGIMGKRREPAGRNRDTSHDEADLIEKGMSKQNDTYGRGSLMFLVRHVDNPNDVARLEAAGYRFAETQRVADIIGTSMQIKTRNLEEKLRTMAKRSEIDCMPEPSVHVGFFAVQARLDKFGFNVMVDRKTMSTLPTQRLPYRRLEKWQTDILRDVDGLPVQTLLIRLAITRDYSPREAQFAGQLRSAVASLRAEVDHSALDSAIISSKVVEMPCLSIDHGRPATCPLITLQVVLDINSRVRNRKVDFIPLQFFKVQQLVHDNSPHHASFSRAMHREISSVLTFPSTPGAKPANEVRKSSSMSTVNLSQSSGEFGHPSKSLEASSSNDIPTRQLSKSTPKPSLFGGIMVSQEIAIQISDAVQQDKPSRVSKGLHIMTNSVRKQAPAVIRKKGSDSNKEGMQAKVTSPHNPSIEMERVNTPTVNLFPAGGNFGMSNVAGSEKEEEASTYVDELFASYIERRS